LIYIYIKDPVDRGLLSGFFVGTRFFEVVNISHLLFVDDTLVFCGANLDYLCCLHVLFLCFEVVLGLKVNLAKSVLVLVGNVDNVDGLASILGCGVSSLRLKYLGLALGACYKAKSIGMGLLKRFERCLVSWKRMYLSKGGKVTLIKSTLQFTYVFLVSLSNFC
jgi:hypothetical protein